MNKVILMGRLTRDPEVRYSQSATPVAVAKYGLAVRRPYVRQGEPDVDFFNITAFGKAGEFAEKFFKKGQMVAIVGRLQVNATDKDGTKHIYVEVIAEEQHFAGSKKDNAEPSTQQDAFQQTQPTMEEDDDLPF